MKIVMFIIHHTFRTLWSVIIGFFYAIGYFLIHLSDKEWKTKKLKWDNIKSLDELTAFFKDDFEYKWDGKNGILDHDNSIWEFIESYGDCDDAAKFAAKKLRKIGYKAWRIGIFCRKTRSWHYDCMFVGSVGNQKYYYLFNYGKVLSGKTKEEVLLAFCRSWVNYPEDKTVYWRCFW